MATLEREAGARRATRRRPLSVLLNDETWLGRLMLAPAILYIVLLVGIPFFLALYYSVSDITLGSQSLRFVGLKNYVAVFETTKFRAALRNTVVFAVISQVIVMVLANVLALLLQKSYPGKWVIRFLLLLPWVAPISLGTIGWLWILDSTYSVINWTFQALGLVGLEGGFMWLGVPNLAMGSIITIHVWRILPLATIVILAGLGAIPQEIHDAAAVDGAGPWRKHFLITLPLVRPVMMVAGLFGLVFAFTDMIVVYVLTRGGPYDTTQVLATLAFFTGIAAGDLGEGAAIALFLFPLLVAAAAVMLTVARRAEVT
jgi:multiple sugar transport system permease protein